MECEPYEYHWAQDHILDRRRLERAIALTAHKRECMLYRVGHLHAGFKPPFPYQS